MSVGNSVRKIVAEFNVGLRISKFMGGYKPNPIGARFGTPKCQDIPYLSQKQNSLSVCETNIKKFCFVSPKLDVTIQKSIIEPEKGIKINFELPIRNSVTALDLPFHTEKEINEPGKVISKKAVHMIRVRKRKMKKHKKKKSLKKHAVLIAKKQLQKRMRREENLQTSLRAILSEKDNFSAEKYVEEILEKVHWEPPVTRVRGKLAPQWVIKQHLEEMEEKKNIQQRVEECSK